MDRPHQHPRPYKPHLHQRWAEGCTVARRLFEEVRERGYPGGENVVKVYMAELRADFPPTPPHKAPSVRDETSWLTRHPDRLTDDQAQQLKATLARCPALDRTAQHVRVFAELMNDRQGKHLDQWITQVQADDLPALHTFVTGLGQDLDAAVAGLSLRYSSGAVQGQNNKIKMLKRQMFGRANYRPTPQTGPPHRARPFMIAVVVTLRGPGTESDPEPLFTRR
ncbi:hypothetical protein DMH25_20630 [Streptomyces sp. WAC 01325]|uniref:transposase n=1 Tax=Streptomyces sp. WAC 01325 TaxID=2203202 RepID=UPI000F88EB01|nr:transposase [Streptomyces sp. WAC 01325]RSN05248.1 hypothetical protein DMH25_20630 [Streptomyces sp. WAC 01325]